MDEKSSQTFAEPSQDVSSVVHEEAMIKARAWVNGRMVVMCDCLTVIVEEPGG